MRWIFRLATLTLCASIAIGCAKSTRPDPTADLPRMKTTQPPSKSGKPMPPLPPPPGPPPPPPPK